MTVVVVVHQVSGSPPGISSPLTSEGFKGSWYDGSSRGPSLCWQYIKSSATPSLNVVLSFPWLMDGSQNHQELDCLSNKPSSTTRQGALWNLILEFHFLTSWGIIHFLFTSYGLKNTFPNICTKGFGSNYAFLLLLC